jgi:hypothetical protein
MNDLTGMGRSVSELDAAMAGVFCVVFCVVVGTEISDGFLLTLDFDLVVTLETTSSAKIAQCQQRLCIRKRPLA